MTDKTTPVVEQRHRDAAADALVASGDITLAELVRDPTRPPHGWAIAFARFERDHMQPAKADALREAAKYARNVFWIVNHRGRVSYSGQEHGNIGDVAEALRRLEAALQSTPEQPASEPENVCANCKGMIGDLARGRDPEELCDTCYADSRATPQSPTPASPSLDEVERVEIDRPFMLAAARAWWAVHMGGNVRAINITGDGRVKVAWSDADESGHYTLPVDFLTALSAPASATSERWPLGTQVHKVKGSAWHGKVVGHYSTDLTPVGYAVESEREPGSVQIYPQSALERGDAR